MIGGFDPASTARVGQIVDAYDHQNDQWSTVSPTLLPRVGSAAAVANGKIYVFGGANPSASSTIEEYDPASDNWRIVGNLRLSRNNLTAETVNGKIYVIGGANNRIFDSVEVFDPATIRFMYVKE